MTELGTTATTTKRRRKEESHGNRTVRNRSKPGDDSASMSFDKNELDFSSHFHISIAWSLGSPSAEALEQTRSASISDLKNVKVRFNAVKFKIGNAVTCVPLSKEVGLGKGLIGNSREL